MFTNPLLMGLLVVAVVGATATVWHWANVKGYRSRLRRRTHKAGGKTKRQSDSRKLSRQERELYKQSKKLLKQSKASAAARILEQLKMPREAIQILEDAGRIDEAATILMRMQRPNRAGVIYARHGMWESAANAFKVANMPAEAAKCARESGNFLVAAENFEKVRRWLDAAECFYRAGEIHRAAQLSLLAGETERAMKIYQILVEKTKNLNALEIDISEVEQIIEYLSAGYTGKTGLAALVHLRHRGSEVALKLVSKGFVQAASEVYQCANHDIGPQLIAEVNYQDKSADCLAQMFNDIGQYTYAGMVMERMNAFDRAGEAFEKAAELERALYCYERAGFTEKIKDIRKQLKDSPKKKSRNPESPNGRGSVSPFSLMAVDDSTFEGRAFDDEVSNTALISGDHPLPIPPPPKRITIQFDPTPEGQYAGGPGPSSGMDPPMSIPPTPIDPQSRPPEYALEQPQLENVEPVAAPVAAPEPESAPAHEPDARPTFATTEEPAVDDVPGRGVFALSKDKENEAAPEAGASPTPPPPTQAPQPSQKLGEFAALHEHTLSGTAQERKNKVDLPAADEKNKSPTPSENDPAEGDKSYNVFSRATVLAVLDSHQMKDLWNIGKTEVFDENEVILSTEDDPKGLYIILSGKVGCYRELRDTDSYLDDLGEADAFGELWILAGHPFSLNFIATIETKIHIITEQAFTDLLDKNGTIARKLYKSFTARLLKRVLKPQNDTEKKKAS